MKMFKRLAAAMLLVCLLVGSLSLTSVEAALKKPTGLKFIGWEDTSYSKAYIQWNAVSGAQAYEVRHMYTDNSNIKNGYIAKTMGYISGLKANRVYRVMVRALTVDSNGKITSRGPWSDTIYTLPMPKTIKATALGKTSKSGAKLQWSTVYGTNGYVVQMTTNASGKWYSVKTTTSQSATSASFKKYRGSNFQKYKNYYYRVVSRRKVGSKYKTTPIPASYYHGYFKWS